MDNQGSNNNYNNGNSNGGNNGDGGKGNHNGQILMAFILISLIALFIMSLVTNQFNQMSTQEVSYSEFLDMVNGTGKWEGRSVKSVEIGSYQIDITLDSDEKTPYEVTYYCGRVADDELIPLLKEKGVDISGVIPDNTSTWIYSILSYLIPLVLIWVVLGVVMRRMGGGTMGVGKSNAKVYVEKQTGVTFKDVAGQDEAKESLQEVVDFLHNPKKYRDIGAKLPKGALLVGPPGTGKTLLAKAVAGEAKVPFFSLAGSDFVEMFVGVGASRVRDLFKEAQKQAPCIIFIDEIDAVARRRGAGVGGGHDEREQTLNQMLVEMDGFDTGTNVIVIAATNRPDVLDPALLRPGRFDRQVVVPLPDIRGREQILRVHMRKVPIGQDVREDLIARGTPGFSGADLANLVNEAALYAARRNARLVEMIDFENAKDKIMMGAERRGMVMTEEERKNTAYHESGHAVVARMLPGTDPVHKVTIIPRGRALGLTMQLPTEDRYSYDDKYILNQIAILFGGRIAEEVFMHHATTGASNDFERATSLARDMVIRYGMSENLGPMVYAEKEGEVFLGKSVTKSQQISEATMQKVDQEIRRIIDQQYALAQKIITDNRDKMEAMAHALLEWETIDSDQIDDIMAGRPPRPPHQVITGDQPQVDPERARQNEVKEAKDEPQQNAVSETQPPQPSAVAPEAKAPEAVQPPQPSEKKDPADSPDNQK